MIRNPITVAVDGEEYSVYPINNDVNGNARYVMHYLAFDIPNYDSISKYGFSKYRGKSFGGGIVFQAINLDDTIKYMLDKVKEVNRK